MKWTRWQKLIAGATAALVALALTFVVGLELLSRSSWFERTLRERALAALERAVGGGVQVGDVAFDRSEFALELRDVEIEGLPGQPPLAKLPRVRVGLGVRSLLRGASDLKSLEIDSPEIRLPGGPEVEPAERLDEVASDLLELGVRRLEVRDGLLRWGDERTPFAFQAEGVDLRGRFEPEQERYWLDVEAETVELQGAPEQPRAEQLTATLLLDRNWLRAEDLRFEAEGLSVEGSGALGGPDEPRADLHLEARGPVEPLARKLAGWPIEGRLDLSADLAWLADEQRLNYQGRLSVEDASWSREGASIDDGRLTARFEGDRARLELLDLEASVLGGRFAGRVAVEQPFGERRWRLAGRASGFRLSDALRAAAPETPLPPVDAVAGGAIEVHSTEQGRWRAQARLDLEPAGPRPLAGQVELSYQAGDGRLSLREAVLRGAGGRLEASGEFDLEGRSRLEIELSIAGQPEFRRLLEAFEIEPALVVELDGPARVTGTLEGRLSLDRPPQAEFRGFVVAGPLSLGDYRWSRLEARLTLTPNTLDVAEARLIDGRGRLSGSLAADWTDADDPADVGLTARIDARELPIAKLAASFGAQLGYDGVWSGRLEAKGSLAEPWARASLQARNGRLAGQPFDQAKLEGALADGRLSLAGLELTRDGSLLAAAGEADLAERSFDLRLRGRDWSPAELAWAESWEAKPAGRVTFDVTATGLLPRGEALAKDLRVRGRWQAADLRLGEQELGPWSGSIGSDAQDVLVELAGAPFGGGARGLARVEPDSGAFSGELTFSDWQADALTSSLALDFNVQGSLSGSATFHGDLKRPADLEAEGVVERLELRVVEIPGADEPYRLTNPAPLRWSLADRSLRLEQARLQGAETDLEAGGAIRLAERELDVTITGAANLRALEALFDDLEASGASHIEVRATGPFEAPRVTGRLRLVNADLRSTELPNGLSQLNGEIDLNGRELRIVELAGSSGGGRVHLGGVIRLERDDVEYRLTADAERVRVRYPASLSSVVSGRLAFTGARAGGLVTGQIVVERAATAPEASLAALLAALREPTPTPDSNPLLRSLRLNVGVTSRPDMEIDTSLIRQVETQVELRAVGTAVSPSLLGSVSVTRGQIDFQGSRYTINRGDIDFVNPFRIEPVLDFQLETRIRDVDITLILAGPARQLNVSWVSDPPLSFADLVNLVAVGRSPTLDPLAVSEQRLAQQSLFQTGANTFVEEALDQAASPGLTRFFGVSRLKVDPQVGGAEATPTARISTEQQLTNEVTLIYTYDLSSTQQQTFRLEWAPNRRWTFVVTRDQNGLVGSDVLFKTRLR